MLLWRASHITYKHPLPFPNANDYCLKLKKSSIPIFWDAAAIRHDSRHWKRCGSISATRERTEHKSLPRHRRSSNHWKRFIQPIRLDCVLKDSLRSCLAAMELRRARTLRCALEERNERRAFHANFFGDLDSLFFIHSLLFNLCC